MKSRDHSLEQLDAPRAEAIVEDLRFGVPPTDYVRVFTVGRQEQLIKLERSLGTPGSDGGAALLVKANYGGGKTHLLRVIREIALDSGYAVSLVVVNAQEGVRFNRIDTILGAVCRDLELDYSGRKGVGRLFDSFADASGGTLSEDLKRARDRISSRGKWDYSDYLKSPAIYVALRAWLMSQDKRVRDLIEGWLAHPYNYRGQRKLLHQMLVGNLRARFRDPRAEWQFYTEEVFAFHSGGHRQAWQALADLDLIARSSGLQGLVLLFDEFEDVIQNLNRRDLQQQAFLNLFRFFGGDRYPGMSYFAVTPDFVNKCKTELLGRGVYDFDYKQFDALPYFEMDQIKKQEFRELARLIRQVHGIAYSWDSRSSLTDEEMMGVVDKLWAVASPERVRRAIQGTVKTLDDRLEQVA